MNKETKVVIITLFSVLLLMTTILVIMNIRKDKVEYEYTKYQFTVTDFTDGYVDRDDYDKIIEYCIKNDLRTDVVAVRGDVGEDVHEFAESLNAKTYYLGYYKYESVCMVIVDGVVCSNLEEVKRYLE